MGFVKDQIIKEWQRGWSSPGDKYVCTKCFDDYALARFVRKNPVKKKCDYCGRKSKTKRIAAPIEDVMAEITAGIHSGWSHPDSVGVPYESAEGGYQGNVIDTYDLIHEELYGTFANDKLRNDIIDAFDAQGAMWCDRHFGSLPPEEILHYGWEEFAKLIKHSVRYVFLRSPDKDAEYRGSEEIPPNDFLDRLGEVVEEVDIVTILPQGTRVTRARPHGRNEALRTPADFGPPPIEKAIFSNRMSPAGIPMFYGVFDRETALKEICDSLSNPDVIATTAEFETARDFPVLNLTELPCVPSIFDTQERGSRPGIIFLRGFSNDLSKRIEKDGREHIEYVPTQVVTEYFRHIYNNPDYGRVRGIIYPSARRKGGKCCVLFFRSEECCEIAPGWDSITKEFKPDVPRFWLGLVTTSIALFDPKG